MQNQRNNGLKFLLIGFDYLPPTLLFEKQFSAISSELKA